ncbi:MAG: TlpA family protein disulfide reductase [Anaerolineales bacterium]|nr:TlpA family protein disulfide reductase [Anaerolineales bacterium]
MSEGMRGHKNNQSRLKILSLMLIGAGLVIFGAVALVILPKPDPVSEPTVEQTDQDFSPAKMDEAAPDLELVDLEGREVSLEDYRGKVVLVNNWATWCPPCRAEMPILEAYYQAHKDEGFVLIGIEAGEPANEVVEFVENYGISFPVWLDPESKAKIGFRNMALPSSYVINPNDMIVLAWTGAVTLNSLEEYLSPLLKE